MGVHFYTNGAWTDSGRIYRNSLNIFNPNDFIDGGNYYIGFDQQQEGTLVESTDTDILLVPCKPNTKYTVFRSVLLKRFCFGFVTTSQTYTYMPVANAIQNNNASYLQSTSESDSAFLILYYAKHSGTDYNTQEEIESFLNTLMINEGEMIPFEPYNVVDWYTNHGHGYSSGEWD